MSDSIVAASTRMKNLINDLLDANAIEQGKYASKLEACDLYTLVKQSVDNNQPAAARKNITLCLWRDARTLGKGGSRRDVTNSGQSYFQCAEILTWPMTTIHVHTMPEAENMVVAVRDQGPGLSEADQKKLFGKFTRLTARPTGGEGSTGLGLSIVKRLAEVMSGTVQCHSVLGAGATFSLRLPKCPKDESLPKITVINPETQPVSIPFPAPEQRAAIRANS